MTLACVAAASLTYATTQLLQQARLNSDPELDGLTPFERNAPLFKKCFAQLRSTLEEEKIEFANVEKTQKRLLKNGLSKLRVKHTNCKDSQTKIGHSMEDLTWLKGSKLIDSKF